MNLFDHWYNLWQRKGHPVGHLSIHLQNMRKFEFIQNGIHYHATFLMDTRSIKIHRMKKEPWHKDPDRFCLVVDQLLYEN